MISLLKVLAFSFIITGFIAMFSNLYLGRSELVSLYKSLQDNVNIKRLSQYEGSFGIIFGTLLLLLLYSSYNMRILFFIPLCLLTLIYIPLRTKLMADNR